jgi:hypothetical protein
MRLWNLLPASLVTRAKAIAAVIGGIAYVTVSFFPSLATNHYVAAAIAVLTALGVWKVPNSNAKVRALKQERLAAKLATMQVHPTSYTTGSTHGITVETYVVPRETD